MKLHACKHWHSKTKFTASYGLSGSKGLSNFGKDSVKDYRLIITKELTAKDVKSCIYSIVHSDLSSGDVRRIVLQMQNIKIFFLYGFEDQMADYLEPIKLALYHSNMRTKRWIWSQTFSDLTGLATSKSVTALTHNQVNIVTHEKQMDVEMIALHNEMMDILNHSQNQSDSLSKMLQNENSMNINLQSVISDELDIPEKLNKVSSALEILLDISLQYSVIFSNLDLIPMLLEEAEQVIHSVLGQLASVELLPLLRPEAHLAQLDPAAMLFIEISSIANENGFFVQNSLPSIDDSFKLLQIKTIPFPTKNSAVFFELNLDYSLIAEPIRCGKIFF